MKLLDIPPNYLNKELALKICSNKPLRKKYINKHLGGADDVNRTLLYYKYKSKNETDNVKSFYTWCETLTDDSIIVSHGGRIRRLIESQPEEFTGTWEIMYVGVPKSILKTREIFQLNKHDNKDMVINMVINMFIKKETKQQAEQKKQQTVFRCSIYKTDRYTNFNNLYKDVGTYADVEQQTINEWKPMPFLNEIKAHKDANNKQYECLDINQQFIKLHKWNPNNTLRSLYVNYNNIAIQYINNSNTLNSDKKDDALYHCIGNGAILKYINSKKINIYIVRHFPSEANLKEKTVGNSSKIGKDGVYDYLSKESCRNFLYDTTTPENWGTGNYKLSENADLCNNLRTIFETGKIYTSQLLRTYQTALLLEKYLSKPTPQLATTELLIVDDKDES
jgi:hypothetical protein